MVRPNSGRLQILEPFSPWDGRDFVDLPILVKTKGKTTTDHISPAGPRLRFRGHIDKISDNMFLGAVNAFTGEAGKGVHPLSGGEPQPFTRIARDLKARGVRWVVIGDENYGEGSSREHAAMSPRYLGCAVVLVKSFARIHETNLKKQGILPLTFKDPRDYDRFGPQDRVSVTGLATLAPGKPVTVTIRKPDGRTETIEALHGRDCPPNLLPDETLDVIREFLVAIKGPLTTPVGEGFRSLNVTLRQVLDLYVCLRPVKYFQGVPSPVKRPDKVDMVIFRENTEDIYAGIEWEQGTPEAKKVVKFLQDEMKVNKIRFPNTSSIGIKPISKEGSERLIRAAIRYAIENNRKNVTLVHKGNIQKYTEGMFMKWGYALAKREFGDKTISWDECGGKPPEGRILIKDAITDAFLQQILTRPDEFDVLPSCNLTGDLLSDAPAAQVGGIGIAPGANINYDTGHALFEATHGTAPKYAGQDKVNPGSVILSGEMMFRYLGWTDTADRLVAGLEKTIQSKVVTYDFARLMEGAKEVKCSEFGSEIIKNMATL